MDTKSLNYQDFHKMEDDIELLLETTDNLSDIIQTSLSFCSNLSLSLPFEEYYELHFKFLTYFANLRKMFQSGRFSADSLQSAFYQSLFCPMVVPRLYLCLIIACSYPEPELIDILIPMFNAICNPMRAFFFRTIAITFISKTAFDSKVSFAIENFEQMIDILPDFLQLSPTSLSFANNAITTNVVLALSFDTSKSLKSIFFNGAKKISEKSISTSTAIVNSILGAFDSIPIHDCFDLFSDYFQSVPKDDEAFPIIISLCKKENNPSEIFDFIIRTPYADIASPEITDIALYCHDIEVVSKCLLQWPQEAIFHKTLQVLGPTVFSQVMDIFNSSSSIILPLSVIAQFLSLATEDTTIPVSSLRNIIKPFFKSGNRPNEIRILISELLVISGESPELYEQFLAPPFEFSQNDSMLLKLLIIRGLNVGCSKEQLLKIINSAIAIPQYLKYPLICLVTPISSLIQQANKITDEFSHCYLISYLSNISSKEELNENNLRFLLESFTAEKELFLLFHLATNLKFSNISQKCILEILKLTDKRSFKERAFTYIKILNSIFGVIKSDLEFFDVDFVNQILDFTISFFKSIKAMPLPLVTENVLNSWVNILKWLVKQPEFQEYSSKLSSMLVCLQ